MPSSKSKRVQITLSAGQQRAIRESILFDLCGRSYSETVGHLLMRFAFDESRQAIERRAYARIAALLPPEAIKEQKR